MEPVVNQEESAIARRLRDREEIREEMLMRGCDPVTLEPLHLAGREPEPEETRGF